MILDVLGPYQDLLEIGLSHLLLVKNVPTHQGLQNFVSLCLRAMPEVLTEELLKVFASLIVEAHFWFDLPF